MFGSGFGRKAKTLTFLGWVQKVGQHEDGAMSDLSQDAFRFHLLRQIIVRSINRLLTVEPLPFRFDFAINLPEA